MTKSCLIVDDSKVVRKVARGIMESLGFAVEEAGDGLEAVAACEKKFPLMILLDWHMPNMDGLQFVKHLRTMPGGDKPIVIFCTTQNDMASIQQAIEAGANEYVMKPFDGDIIREKLAQVGLE